MIGFIIRFFLVVWGLFVGIVLSCISKDIRWTDLREGIREMIDFSKIKEAFLHSSSKESQAISEFVAEMNEIEPIDLTYNIPFNDTVSLKVDKSTKNEWYTLENMEPITELKMWSIAKNVAYQEGGVIEVSPNLDNSEIIYRDSHFGWHDYYRRHSIVYQLPEGGTYDTLQNKEIEADGLFKDPSNQQNSWLHAELATPYKTTYFNPVTNTELSLTPKGLFKLMIYLRRPEMKQEVLENQRAEIKRQEEEEKRQNDLKYAVLMKHETRIREMTVDSINPVSPIKKEISEKFKGDEKLLDKLIDEIQSKQYTSSDYFDIVDKKLK